MDTEACVIVGAGEVFPPLREGSLLIAADGGFDRLSALGIVPDLVIGDLDSVTATPEHPNILRLPREKDDTDTLAALKYGLGKGCRVFHIYGGLGGRPDHSIANVQTLIYAAKNGARAYLYGSDYVITAFSNGILRFAAETSGFVSVFACTEKALGVNICGLKYELRDAELSPDCPIGVSNEFTGTEALISVRSGVLLVSFPINARELK